MSIKSVLLLLCLAIMVGSCGTGKKLKASEARNDSLMAANNDLAKRNKELEAKLSEVMVRDEKLAEDLKRYIAECQASKEKLMIVETKLREEYEKLQALKDKIAAALVDFNNKGVDVFYKDGYVYVSMQDNLLYKSGSAVLGKNAKSALEPLSKVLNDYPDLKIIVLGNTDDAMFKKGSGDNWSLSTERANGVIRSLRDDYKIDPVRMTSSGKGRYNPVADNSTPEGRAKNRRTEIILNPDLEKIWESIQK